LTSAPAKQETLLIAAASDLQFAMGEIEKKFEEEMGTEIKVSYGSSGLFFSQIVSGAPFDVFLSADVGYPQRLVSEGWAEAPFIYGRGHLVLWVSDASPINLSADGMKSLRHPSVRKIAIANPIHAPYGVAATALLHKHGLYDTVRPMLVFGENISQAAQFVQSGAADIGMLSYSLVNDARLSKTGRHWMIPPEDYPVLHQGGVLLKKSVHVSAVRSFIKFLLSGEGQVILKRHGFS